MTWEQFKQTRPHKTLINVMSTAVIGSTTAMLILDGIDWLHGIKPRIPLALMPLGVLAVVFMPAVLWVGWLVTSVKK